MSAVVVERVSGPASVQDLGRPGRMHEGVPPGGALVPELLLVANHAADNAPEAAAIEAFGGLTLVAAGAVRVGLDDGTSRALSTGERLELSSPSPARVRYIALHGGIDVTRVLGGRGTLIVASLGGHEGRWLRRGDELRAGHDRGRRPLPFPLPVTLAGLVRVIPGPDLDRFTAQALDVLVSSPFVVSSQSDRIGTRLTGPNLPRLGDDRAPSAPMVRGAIQVPASGAPIALGPDHPTTGGYPVLACIIRADHGAFAARPPGAEVRFSLAGAGR